MATTASNKRKKAVAATVAAAALLLAGTFAWTSISQQTLNESAGIVNVGGRLHDDFNGENKDVYVENFTDPLDGGQPIYARVKLTEYMEVGQDAGGHGADVDDDGTSGEAVPVIDGTSIDDKDSWIVHNPLEDGANCEECETAGSCRIHDHWTWTMGGETTYMPTFNKDKDSKEADRNGTYQGTKDGDKVYYDDYVVYKTEGGVTVDMDDDFYNIPQDAENANQLTEANAEITEVTGTAFYDNDTDQNADSHDIPVNDANVRTETETHTAKATASATVVTMQQWKAMGSPVGPYWVYDTDGWAYWAAPIMPGEATGLLLDGIKMTKNPGEKCYYAINVVGQFATVDDWSFFHPDDGTSQEPDVSDAAKALLDKAAASVVKVNVTNDSQKTTIGVIADAADRTVNFSADTFIGTSTDEVTDSYTWEVYNADLEPVKSTITDDGVLTVSPDETNESLIVAARSTNYPGAVGLSSVAVSLEGPEVITTDELSATAYAILTLADSSTDKYDMTFVRSNTPISAGYMYEDKKIAYVYTDFEQSGLDYWGTPWTGMRDYIVSVNFANNIQPTDMTGYFMAFSALTSVNIEKLDTSKASDVDSVFRDCPELESITLPNGFGSAATKMSCLFDGASSLKTIEFEGTIGNSNLTSISNMCTKCSALESFDMTKVLFNTAAAIDFDSMFSRCNNLSSLTLPTNIKVSGLDTTFSGCNSLSNEDLSVVETWDVSQVDRFYDTFQGCYLLEELDLRGWNTEKANYFLGMFRNCTGLEKVDVSSFVFSENTSSAPTIESMFSNCTNLTEVIGAEEWDTQYIRSMYMTFYKCSNLILDCDSWNTSNVSSHYYFNENASGVIAPTWKND